MKYILPENKYEVFIKNINIKHTFDKLTTKLVTITEEQRKKCIEYAKNEVNKIEDFTTIVPKEIKDNELRRLVAEQKIFIGKIAECGFINYLIKNDINPSVINKNKIDLEVAIAKDIHTRLIISKEEFEKNKKNYYVGIHLNLELEDKKDPIKRHIIKDLYNIKEVQIYGYLDKNYIKELRYETVKNSNNKKEFKFFNKKSPQYKNKAEYANLLGEKCKWYYMDRLMSIDNLIKKLK